MPYRSKQSALPETMTPDEVADRLGMKLDTVRRWIRADMADGGHRIPGGRCEGSRFVIIRAVFERAMRQGIEPESSVQVVTPDVLELAARLRQRAAEDLELADRLAELAVKTKGRR
jgi:excisionase family DNA binding protein